VGASAQRRSQEKRTSQTRAELVDAAVRCINELGYARATTREIARYAQLSPGALQYQFGGKDALMLAVILDMRTRLSSALAPSQTALSQLPGDRVDMLVEQYWSVVSGAEYQAVMQIMVGAAAGSVFHRAIIGVLAEAEREQDEQWMASFADIGPDPKVVTHTRRVVLATLRGVVLRRLHSDRDQCWIDERKLLAEMTRQRLVG